MPTTYTYMFYLVLQIGGFVKEYSNTVLYSMLAYHYVYRILTSMRLDTVVQSHYELAAFSTNTWYLDYVRCQQSAICLMRIVPAHRVSVVRIDEGKKVSAVEKKKFWIRTILSAQMNHDMLIKLII